MRRNLQAGRRRFGALSLEMFTEDDLVDIHQATLEVLADAGVFVEDAGGARASSPPAAARSTTETKVVRIPPHVVEAAIRSAPSTLLLAGRDPANDFVMGPGRVGFTNFGEGIKIVDVETGELREPTKQDVGDSARVVDALPEVDVYERAVGATRCRSRWCSCTTPRWRSRTRASTSSWAPATASCCGASSTWGRRSPAAWPPSCAAR